MTGDDTFDIAPDWLDGETKALEAPHDHRAELGCGCAC